MNIISKKEYRPAQSHNEEGDFHKFEVALSPYLHNSAGSTKGSDHDQNEPHKYGIVLVHNVTLALLYLLFNQIRQRTGKLNFPTENEKEKTAAECHPVAVKVFGRKGKSQKRNRLKAVMFFFVGEGGGGFFCDCPQSVCSLCLLLAFLWVTFFLFPKGMDNTVDMGSFAFGQDDFHDVETVGNLLFQAFEP